METADEEIDSLIKLWIRALLMTSQPHGADPDLTSRIELGVVRVRRHILEIQRSPVLSTKSEEK